MLYDTSRKFMLIRHIEANSTNKLKTELFDYTDIDLVNEAYFSITATSGEEGILNILLI